MTRAVRHTLTALIVAVLLASCGGRPRIIPRAVLTDIYADMFLADQWLQDHRGERGKLDTMLFYDPIFARYGYTFEDYDATVQRYIKDPEKFAKVFRDAGEKLKKDMNRYARLADRQRRIREYNALFRGQGFDSLHVDSDTILWSPPITDSLLLDSLKRVAFERDSLERAAFVRDSLQRDSVERDSLERVRRETDEILRKKMERGRSRPVISESIN